MISSNRCDVCFSDNISSYSETEDGPVVEIRCDQCDLEVKVKKLEVENKELRFVLDKYKEMFSNFASITRKDVENCR